MAWLKQLCLSWIILSAARVSCQELTSTLHEGNRTCPGEEVIFTCTVRGPSTLPVIAVGWSSPEYITGQSGSLQLSTANVIGHFETSTGMDGSITATATVTNNINVNGELILESTLRITGTVASTVTCRDPNQGPESIEFTISAVPGVPQRISAVEVSRPRDNICIILVQWNPPANSDAADIVQYIIYVPSRNIREVSSSTVSTLTLSNCDDGIRILVAAVNRVGCVGMNSSEVQPTLLDIPAGPTDDGSTTTDGGLATTEGGSTSRKSTEMLLCEMSITRQQDFQKNLVDFYVAIKKDLTEDKLSYMENLSRMMENQKLTKRYIKEAVKIALKSISVEDGEDVKNVLIYLKDNIPRVMSSFSKELEDKGTNITMANLIHAAEQNEHAEVFDELMEIMDNTKPEIVEGLLRTMFEELQTCLQSKASSVEMKQVTNLSGRTSSPNSKDGFTSGQMDFCTK